MRDAEEELAKAIQAVCGPYEPQWVGTEDMVDEPRVIGLEGHFTADHLRKIADLMDAYEPPEEAE